MAGKRILTRWAWSGHPGDARWWQPIALLSGTADSAAG